MQTIVVKTQDEMDAIPLNFHGRIDIRSEPNVTIKITKSYDSAKVRAYNSATVHGKRSQ